MEIDMKRADIGTELSSNTYPGRGIVIGKSPDGNFAVTAYFIMGRSENSRNRIFVEEGEGIRTQAFDPEKLTDEEIMAEKGREVTRLVIDRGEKDNISVILVRSVFSQGSHSEAIEERRDGCIV